MLGNPFFFHDLITKHIVIFASCFEDLYISREIDGQQTQFIEVKLKYAPKEKVLARLEGDPDLTKQAAVVLPAVSFELTGIERDSNRVLERSNNLFAQSNTGTTSTIHNPIPYNFNFSLYIYFKAWTDGLKLLEQILPFFDPEYNLTAHLIPEMNIIRNIPIVLNGRPDLTDTYDGDFADRRHIVWTLNFTVKGWLFGPVSKSSLIKFVRTNFIVPGGNDPLQDLVGIVSPIDRVTVQPGLTANGQPTSNVENSVSWQQINASDNYGIIKTIYGDLDPKEGTGGATEPPVSNT